MKKFFKIALYTFAALLIIIILIPIFFKKPIMNKVKEEMNNTLNAKVEFSDFTISLIRGFPNFYVALEDLTIVGIGEFEKDTLVSFDKFSAKIDLISAIKMENIKIKSVFLDKPSVYAHVLKNGKVNWDIVKPSADSIPEDTTSSELEFKVSLKKFEIRNARIAYVDDSSDMKASLDDLDLLLSGNFTESTTDATLKTSIEKVNFYMEGMRYLRDTRFALNVLFGADMDKMLFTIRDNEINLNDLSMGIEGTVAMPGEDIDMDLKFNTKKADFKSLLSLVPAVYMKDFEKVQTSGSLKLDGFAKGTYSEKTMPNVGITLGVDNAMFKYPDLPKSVNNINVDAKLFYDGVQDDNTTVDVNKFHVEMAGNPFDMELHIKTPMSDMQIAGNFKGRIDFSSLTDVVPLDSTTLKGIMESNIDMSGRMSSIDKEQYEDFKADGTLKLSNFEFVSKDFPQGIKIVETNMVFSPRFVELTSFNALIGKSDLNMTGKLSNFIPYVFKDDTIVGSLNFSSNLLDINEMMGTPAETEQPVPEDTSAMTVIEIPGNVDFTLNTKIATIKYDNMNITNVLGTVLVRNSTAVLKNLGMNMLDGSLVMNGEYNTQDVKSPLVDFSLNMKDFDIPSTFTTFNTVKKLAPVAQNAKGKISADMAINTRMDEHMNPLYNTMQGKGKLMSNSIEIGNSNMFNKIADALKNEKLRKFSMNDLNLSFEIKDGRVYIEPFETKLWTGKMIIGGDQGIDQTLNYALTFSIPRSEFGGAANAALVNLTSAAASKGLNIQPGEMVNINASVLGTVTKPEVKLNLKESAQSALKDVKDQIKTVAAEKVEAVKEDVKAKAREQADRLIKDAEGEAQKIRDAAKDAADRLRKETDAAAEKLVKDVKNPIQKVAQQKIAERTKKEGYAKADQLEKEADVKAQALIDKAKAEADKL